MFVKDCWYVAAWDYELKVGAVIARTIIGEPIMLYRDEGGEVHVLEDRCCHRFAPLSKGRIEDGCNIRCMYHGLKFDPLGKCIEIPGQDKIPDTARVRAYPVVERSSWLWVWMGDPAMADEAIIPPAVGLDDPKWTLRSGQMDYEANYLLINDNLTDFSHLSYVHANSFGATEIFARTRPNVKRLDRGIRVSRWVMDGFSPDNRMGRRSNVGTALWQTYDFLAPGVLLMLAENHHPSAIPEDGVSPPTETPIGASFTSQAVTPMTDGTSRYFYSWGPLAGEGSDAQADQMAQVAFAAFTEDREMIEAQQKIINIRPGTEVLTTADVGPVQMRSIIRKLAKMEMAPAD